MSQTIIATAPTDDLIVSINPHNHDYVEFIGPRALLEAEGLIPADAEWPDGYHTANWQAGGFHYGLRRQRPDGAKGPRCAFAAVDWFCLRRTPEHPMKIDETRIAINAKELKDMLYRKTPKGQAEWNVQWSRYFKAKADQRFQAFKAACGIVDKKFGRPRNSQTTQQGDAA